MLKNAKASRVTIVAAGNSSENICNSSENICSSSGSAREK
jgi:hypothetical protein